METAGVIDVANLAKSFDGITAVDDISFDVRKGEIFGFLGPNGAGKTTTTRILTGIIPMDAGSVRIFGHDIRAEPVRVKERFGIVPETSNAYVDLTGWQNLMLAGELYGLDRHLAKERATGLLGTLDLLERRDQRVRGYSKGMRQRLILAMALIHEPELLFLDEPTSGLDVQSTMMILDLLRRLNAAGTTIFLTTHNMEEANRLCDRVGIIHRGRMAAIDAPERLKAAVEQIHRIEVSFDSSIPEAVLGGLDGITDVERTGDKWRVTAPDPDAAIRSLVAMSDRHGASILTLQTLAPSLDEAFLRLTGEERP